MGWFKKVISIVFRFTLVRPILWLFTSIPKKLPVPPVAGSGASAEEIAAMKQMEEAHMSEEEKQAKAKNDLKLVISGAKIQCTMCSNPTGTLLATHNTPSIQGQPAAISTDKEKLNLIFAGTCLKLPNTPTPCIALIQPGQWQDTGSFKMQGESPLLLKSTIRCMFGGVDIKITDCGQRSIFAYDAPTEMEEDTDENSQMRIAVFFDGTRNNMKNTEAREEYFKLHGKRPYEDPKFSAGADRTKAAIYAKTGNKKDDSYESGYSNVALLSKYYKKELNDPEKLRDYCYVEGIATGDWEHDAYVKDSMNGYAFAKGETGIEAKVEKGCLFAANKIDKLNKKGKKLKQITIEVFGFSRGAAAARSFLNELKKMPRTARAGLASGPYNASSGYYTIPAIPRYGKLGMELNKLGVDLSEAHIIIRFAGLFDTVSSYGLCFSKEKDTALFGLDAVRLAKNTLHLTAADEHRYFFPLVNIKSAGFNEKVFPGVHSDIGGSYVDGNSEVKEGLAAGSEYNVKEKYKELVREGWYTKEQLTVVKPSFWQTMVDAWKLKPITSPVKYIKESTIRLRGEKNQISAAYSYIPLHIMCDYAMKEGIYVKFRNIQLKEKCNLYDHPKLHAVSDRLYGVVFKNAPEMIFYKRYELEYAIEMQRPGGPDFSFYHKDIRWTDDEIPIEPNSGNAILIESFITDPDLIRKIEDHNAILMLRNEYLHSSADWFELGFNPTQSGERKIYNG